MLSSVVGAARTQASEREAFEQHRTNLLSNLNRRIAIAKSQPNEFLVALLEQEKRQIEADWTRPLKISPLQRLRQSWSNLKTALANQSQLQVEQVQDEVGQPWWYVFDPRTGKTLYAESENEVVFWIEENRLGH
ncbi:MAG: hypothetical protein ICV62_09145 [Cyanobacteria bacterium Co-bin13]|nr:hypothetical protein [Cyanobacteria bacterium Co-bin13]